jgi:hypothetical protein
MGETLSCREIISFFLCGGTNHTPFHLHGEQIIAPVETLGEIIGYMTQLAYRDGLNAVSQYAFEHGKTSSVTKLHQGMYDELRTHHHLPSQLACYSE